MKKRHAIIIHGWEGAPQSNWFPWLRTKLESAGFPEPIGYVELNSFFIKPLNYEKIRSSSYKFVAIHSDVVLDSILNIAK